MKDEEKENLMKIIRRGRKPVKPRRPQIFFIPSENQ